MALAAGKARHAGEGSQMCSLTVSTAWLLSVWRRPPTGRALPCNAAHRRFKAVRGVEIRNIGEK
jgi:hypothetical protein